MQIRIDIEIRDEEWGQLSVASKERYLQKLNDRITVACNLVGEDIAMVLFNTKPFVANQEDIQ